jgi:hypothetical protein
MELENKQNPDDSYEKIKEDVMNIIGNHGDFKDLRDSEYPHDVIMMVGRVLRLAEKEPNGFFGKRKLQLLALEKRYQKIMEQEIQKQKDKKNKLINLEPDIQGIVPQITETEEKNNEIKGIAEILGSEKAINYYKDKDQKEIEKTEEEKQKLNNSYQKIKKEVMNLGDHEFNEHFRFSKSLDDLGTLIDQALEKAEKEPDGAFAKKKLELSALKERIQKVKTNSNAEEDLKKKTELMMDIHKAREEYFKLRKDKSKENSPELKEAEKNYKNTKNIIVKELLDNGEKGKAQEFLFAEVESKRKNDLENKLVGKGERLKAGISNGIEKWDNWGAGKWEGGLKGLKDSKNWKNLASRIAKTSISLGLIGVTSVGSIQGLAQISSKISTSALSGGSLSYLGRKLGIGTAFATALSYVPDKHKKWVGTTLTVGMAGLGVISALGVGATAGTAVAGATFFGYTLSNLTKRYDKKIKGRIEESKNNIDFNNLENAEQEIEKILKAAETTRILGKVMEAGTALAGSVAFLEAYGITHDIHQAKVDAEAQHNTDIKASQDAELKHQAEIKHEAEQMQDATIHKGEGIENAFIKQIEHNHGLAEQLAKESGFKGDLNDAKVLHEFAGREAHVLAIKEGYVDNAGHEVWIKEGNKVAFEIKMENGHVTVLEKTVDGEIIGAHHEGDKFGIGEKEKAYEYSDGKDHRVDPEMKEFYKQSHEEATDELKAIEEGRLHPQPPINQGIHEVKTQTSPEQPKTEHIDTSKPITPSESKEIPLKQPTHIIEGHTYTEEEWMKAPENIYHIHLNDFVHVKELHTSNIDHMVHGQNLSEMNVKNVGEMIKEGSASTMMGTNEIDVKGGIHYTLWQYEHKLEEITGLKPISETHLHPAETNEEYIFRAEMKAAEMHRLDEVKSYDINQHIDPSKTVHDYSPKEPIKTEVPHTQVFPSEEVHINDVYNKNIDHIFPKDTQSNWNDAKTLSASQVFNLSNPGKFTELVNYLHKLENVTGIKPEEGTTTKPSENVFSYVHRALGEAAKHNKLEEIRLKNE